MSEDNFIIDGSRPREGGDKRPLGNPGRLPLVGLVFTLAYLVFASYMVFGSDLNDRLYQIFNCRPYLNNENMMTVAAHDFDFYGDHLYLIAGISLIPALTFCIGGLGFASGARRAYRSGRFDVAYGRCGYAGAFGWSAIIYSVTALAVTFLIFIYAYLWN